MSNEHNNAPAVPDDILARACNLAGLPYETFLKIKSYLPTAQAGTFQEPAVPQGEPVGVVYSFPSGDGNTAWGFKPNDSAWEVEKQPKSYERRFNVYMQTTPAPAPAQEVGLTNRQFDLICQAIDKADTITLEGDYMLDSDDCVSVVRVMQALFDIAALRAKVVA